MEPIILEEKYVLEYIRDILTSLKTKTLEPKNIEYHHNCSYENTPLILQHGILTVEMLNKLGITNISKERLKVLKDIESHVNGIDSISLSKVGLMDLYPDESEYKPFRSAYVDLTISNDIKARRHTVHYGNEYLCSEKIGTDKLQSIDIRLLSYMKNNSMDKIIKKYNLLNEIAVTLQQLNLDIPLREMSKENITIDIDRLSKTPKILIK